LGEEMIKELFGSLLVIASIFDAWKYVWNAQAIRRVGTAKGHSRKFLLAAIFNDTIKLIYGILIVDIFIILSSLLAMATMFYNFYTQYKFYPYRKRGLLHFKRPNILLYFWNSITPNRIRKRL
jgi:hypothetical protein